MSAISQATSQTPIVWNKDSILNRGQSVLRAGIKELKPFVKISGFYHPHTIPQITMGSDIANKNITEINSLNTAVISILANELETNPDSEQAKKLQKISIAARHGLDFYNAVIEKLNAPQLISSRRYEQSIAIFMYSAIATVFAIKMSELFPVLKTPAIFIQSASIAWIVYEVGCRILENSYVIDDLNKNLVRTKQLFKSALED